MKSIKTLSKADKTKKLCLSLLAFLVISSFNSEAFALEYMGPPMTELQQFQGQAELNYTLSKVDLLLTPGNWIEYSNGIISGSGRTAELLLKDFETHSTSINFGYSFAPEWEVFLHLSGTEAEFGDTIWNASEKFESKLKPSFGGGLKATFHRDDKLQIGGLIQGSWSNFQGQLTSALWEMPHFVEMDIKEAQITIGANYLFYNNFSIYGGPFYHYLMGEFDYIFVQDDLVSDNLITEASWEIEADASYGGYIGAQWEFLQNGAVNLEYQFSSAASVIGANISYRY